MLPPTILTEAIAQVGAILILAKPENRDKLPFFRSIERVRYRRPVHPGDVVVIEATVRRLRSRDRRAERHRPRRRPRRRRGHHDVRARRQAPTAPTAQRRTSSTVPIFAARDSHTAARDSGSR